MPRRKTLGWITFGAFTFVFGLRLYKLFLEKYIKDTQWGAPWRSSEGTLSGQASPIQQIDVNSWNPERISSIGGDNQSSTEHVLMERKQKVISLCEVHNRSQGNVLEVTGSIRLGYSLCVVPKAGCTMWIRLFKYLAGQNAKHPMLLTKYAIHYEGKQFYKQFRFKNETDRKFLEASKRAMIVRDPYSRLWSAYIDKLVLPDFWKSKGVEIIKLVRPNATLLSKRCGYDVTFPEFIDYVIRTGLSLQRSNQDKHWLPASYLCDPCQFRPEYISKQESFRDDFSFIMQTLNLTHLSNSPKYYNPVDFAIKDEINYNFNIYQQHSSCISKYELVQKIWRAFTLNGYIPKTESFPERYAFTDTKINETSVHKAILDEREKYSVTSEDTRRMRNNAKRIAFAEISQAQLQQLKELYKMDFAFFGYSEEGFM